MKSQYNEKQIIRNPLIIALDVDTDIEAIRLAKDLSDIAGAFKVGPRLCLRYGQKLIQEIALHAPVFMDNKHFDIPSTMESSIKASFECGASLVTIHGLCGSEALSRMAAIETQLNKERPFKILNVTILTSWDEQSLPKNMQNWNIREHVKQIVTEIKNSGLDGVVCSAHEIKDIQDNDLFIVTPGLQFNSTNEDQKRTMAPAEAYAQGASGLVVGRSIIAAKKPRQVAEEILKSIQTVQSSRR